MSKNPLDKSPVKAYRILSDYKGYPRGLVSSQLNIIKTYYGDKIHDIPVEDMSGEQAFSISRRLYFSAFNTLKQLNPGEREIVKVLIEAEKLPESERTGLEHRVAEMLEQNQVQESSPVFIDVVRLLNLTREVQEDYQFSKPVQTELFGNKTPFYRLH